MSGDILRPGHGDKSLPIRKGREARLSILPNVIGDYEVRVAGICAVVFNAFR